MLCHLRLAPSNTFSAVISWTNPMATRRLQSPLGLNAQACNRRLNLERHGIQLRRHRHFQCKSFGPRSRVSTSPLQAKSRCIKKGAVLFDESNGEIQNIENMWSFRTLLIFAVPCSRLGLVAFPCLLFHPVFSTHVALMCWNILQQWFQSKVRTPEKLGNKIKWTITREKGARKKKKKLTNAWLRESL